jgi:threonine dehydratase
MAEAANFDEILSARDQIQGAAVETPLLRNDALDEATGARVWVKAECLQRTGSFKFRGAYNKISRLSPEERARGVVAYSSGNHAQAVAFAARLVGARALIVMPADAPKVKAAQTKAYGAEVVFYDRVKESREEIAEAIRQERDAVLVRPFDDPQIIAGQGTAGLEAARQLEARGESADLLLCPASGGGLIAGVSLAFEALSPETKIYAVEPQGYEDTRLSLEQGRRVTVKPERPSLCDSLLTTTPGELTFPINQRRLSGALAVSDEEALQGTAFAASHLKLVVEPGGATPLAALLTGKLDVAGRTVAVIASGGNIDPALLARALA